MRCRIPVKSLRPSTSLKASRHSRSDRLRSSVTNQQTPKRATHLKLEHPPRTHLPNRKRKVFKPSPCFAALGTQKVAIKKEKACRVKYWRLKAAQSYRNLQSAERLTLCPCSS